MSAEVVASCRCLAITAVSRYPPLSSAARHELSFDALPHADRMAYWREEFGRFVIRLDVDPLGSEGFHCDVVLTRMAGINLMSGVCSSVQYRATKSLISGNDDAIGIIRNRSPAVVDQLNRESALDAGDGTLLSWTDPLTFTLPAGAASDLIRLPRPVMQALVPNLNDAYNKVIPGQSDALRLLFGYLNVLQDHQAIATPELQHIVVTHVYDLAALALGASRDMAELAKERGLRAARLRAIKEDISARLGEPGLSLEGVALRHRVSPRYVQKLFEMEGANFSDFVRAGRLARIYRMLQDPRLSHLSISTIAYECGFGDITAFNRAFRRHYNASPSDVRFSAKPA